MTDKFLILFATAAHGKDVPEAVLQVSFADKVLLNKIDLIDDSTEMEKIIQSIKNINSTADIIKTIRSSVGLTNILNIRAFDPFRNRQFLEANQSSNNILIKRENGKIAKKKVKFTFNSKSRQRNASKNTEENSNNLATVSLCTNKAIDLDKFNQWISELLQNNGQNIYRGKGILNIKGYAEQFVFQSVHMIVEGHRGESWDSVKKDGNDSNTSSDSIRVSKIVFIGLNLDVTSLETAFNNCVS